MPRTHPDNVTVVFSRVLPHQAAPVSREAAAVVHRSRAHRPFAVDTDTRGSR